MNRFERRRAASQERRQRRRRDPLDIPWRCHICHAKPEQLRSIVCTTRDGVPTRAFHLCAECWDECAKKQPDIYSAMKPLEELIEMKPPEELVESARDPRCFCCPAAAVYHLERTTPVIELVGNFCEPHFRALKDATDEQLHHVFQELFSANPDTSRKYYAKKG